jgi:hypothetical protein
MCPSGAAVAVAQREVAREPELTQVERRVPDALDERVAAGDLPRHARTPQVL